MAFTFIGSVNNPLDNVTLYDSVERSIDVTQLKDNNGNAASFANGDLVILSVSRKSTSNITISNTGGQTWTAETIVQGGSNAMRIFWCKFNGTWSANPSITTISGATTTISLRLTCVRPTSSSNTFVKHYVNSHAVPAPVSPGGITATGTTTTAASTFSQADWHSIDVNTWGLDSATLSAGWLNVGSAYYRNPDASSSRPISTSSAYRILTSTGATGSPVNVELTSGFDLGIWHFITFTEQAAGPSISQVSDGLIYNGETGIHVTGSSFGASHTGSANVIFSPSDNVADGSAITASISAWSDTDITLGAVDLSSFTPFVNIYVFVKDSSGTANSNGFVIKRESRFKISDDLDDGGSPWASQSNLYYRICASSINGEVLLSGSTETTDGSAILDTSYYTLTEGGTLATDDPVWITIAQDNATLANTRATCLKYTPTYE